MVNLSGKYDSVCISCQSVFIVLQKLSEFVDCCWDSKMIFSVVVFCTTILIYRMFIKTVRDSQGSILLAAYLCGAQVFFYLMGVEVLFPIKYLKLFGSYI